MFKKTVAAAVAALTLVGATAVTTSSAQASPLGRAIVAGAIGFGVGAAVAGSSAYAYGYRPAYAYGYGGCGFVSQPIVNPWGVIVGYRRVPAC